MDGIKTMPADVYAYGCLYYGVFYDNIPFQGKKTPQIMSLVTGGQRPVQLATPRMKTDTWDTEVLGTNTFSSPINARNSDFAFLRSVSCAYLDYYTCHSCVYYARNSKVVIHAVGNCRVDLMYRRRSVQHFTSIRDGQAITGCQLSVVVMY